ncbi:MAG: hypothetical protein IKB61_02180, partial [Elusimicrobiaceae bacterium]|nr:hypothetical protein [Elusimicrobiaceae bacterium]
MKKIVLLLVVALMPSFLSAQIQDKSIAAKIWDGQMWDEMDRWPSTENARGIAGATSNFFKFAPDNISDWWNDRDRIYRVEVPTRGFFKLLYNRTEAALTDACKNGYYRRRQKAGPIGSMIQDLFFREGWVETDPTPKSTMERYAYSHANQMRQFLLDRLQKDPYGEYAKVDDATTRRAYEYRNEILACGGLNACRAEVDKKYGENKAAEYKKILQVREDWLFYKDQNPVFKLYTLNGNYEDLQFLNRQDYDALVAFFTNKEPAAGWEYRESSSDYYVNPSPINHNKSVIHGTEIRVRISNNLEADILPEDLSIHIYKTPKDTSSTWKNSKSL